MTTVDKVSTCLWFNDQAEEAVEFYQSLLPGLVEITETSRYGSWAPDHEGKVLELWFTIAGRSFVALNGGEDVEYDHAMSLMVDCDGQDEVDRVWEAMLERGGKEIQCGWIADPWGVNWQIIPNGMEDYITGPDPEGAKRAVEAMFGMKKLVLADLERAYKGQ
ncbi:VOC family protein [Salininema proteolyticum]|uniref:VOC family protein n=1 Tax=Salininema proteolyticum TaxID=1607685 RepID=A0ABV8TV12_9ACTN